MNSSSRGQAVREFVCRSCGWASPKWQGRCGGCGEWNVLIEATRRVGGAARRVGDDGRSGPPARAVPLGEIGTHHATRRPTGMGETDRVLGGGLVAGSLVLLGGDPGIGKSTLALQLGHAVGSPDAPALYCAGEESPSQLALRAGRLGCLDDRVVVIGETAVEGCVEAIAVSHPPLAVVDSVQTLHDPDIPGHPGSPSQVRSAVTRLMECAKESGVPILLVGHVTKDGAIAGPRTLEHMVDVVLYLEGDRHGENRLLRGLKNRFGPASELGLFRLAEAGMVEIGSAGRAFLDEQSLSVPGNVLTVTSEGSRALVVEVQALTVPAGHAMTRRTAWGFDPARLNLLVAVLQRRAHLPLGERDVFLNCAGGVRLVEPGVDLAAALAVWGAEANAGWDPSTVAIGEVGLGGEVRRVRCLEARLAEAAALGIRRAVVPAGQEVQAPPSVECHPVSDLQGAAGLLAAAPRRPRSVRSMPRWMLEGPETVA